MNVHHVAYRLLTTALSPLLPLWLRRRARVGKENPARLPERFGIASRARPDGELFWMHGASVGETTMLLPVIDALLEAYPKAHVLVTSGTVTSAKLMENRLPKRASHQYAPLDTRKAVRRFLTHWQPDLAIWAESEIWPNLVLETNARHIPMALINARMSQKSLKGWTKRKSFAAQIFNCFDYIQAANTDTARGLSAITEQDLAVFANLKTAAAPLPFNAAEKAEFESVIGNRPIWCAASTHPGEDEIILAAHKQILASHPDALLLLAPRHPERRHDILALARNLELSVQLHSGEGQLGNDTAIYMFDTIGDMGLAFSLTPLTLMCGSLREGLFGHNPLEPAQHNSAVFTGPHIESFKDTYEDMFAFGAADTILDNMLIAKTISDLFSQPEILAAKHVKASEFTQSRKAVLGQTINALDKLINRAAS